MITIVRFLLGTMLLSSVTIHADTRIKDIVNIEGVRDNLLVGYGLVVGLNGTGDNLNNSVFTQKGLTDFLEKLGVNVQGSNIKTKNIAAVTVTASLPPFIKQGSTIDVKVAALGDAKSLKGGTLLAAPLLGADGNVYAVAQGTVSIQDFVPISESVRTSPQNIETNGLVIGGAIIENEIDFNFKNMTHINLTLSESDFSTAMSVANAINNNIVGNTARAIDSRTVRVTIPEYRRSQIVEFISELEQLPVKTDRKAKIIIQESTGTVIVGQGVQIKPVAISQGNLNIQVLGNDFTDYSPTMPINKQMKIAESIDSRRGMQMMGTQDLVTLSELIEGLNSLGVMPKDIITILYNMKNVGAIDAHLEVR